MEEKFIHDWKTQPGIQESKKGIVLCFNIIYNIKGLHTYTMGLNLFSDLSEKEWDEMNGYRPEPVEREKGSELVMSKEAPVTTQKNQDYGICTIPCICTFCPGPGGPPPGIPKWLKSD